MGTEHIRKAMALIKSARRKADEGVFYNARDGAICPCCGEKHLRVVTSRAWKQDRRVRFHRCSNPDCLVGQMDLSIKSIEILKL